MSKKKSPETPKLKFFGIPKVAHFLTKYKTVIIAMLVAGLLSSLIDAAMPVLQRYALNHFVEGNTLDTLFPFILVYLLITALTGIVKYFSFFYANRVESSVNRDLRNRCFNHLQTLSFSYFNQNSVGYIHSRVLSDTSRIGFLLSHTLLDSIGHVTYVVSSLTVMFMTNAKLTLGILVVIPLALISFSIFKRGLVLTNRKIRELNSKLTGDFNEGIVGAKTIKSLVIEEKMQNEFFSSTDHIKKTVIEFGRFRGLFSITMNLSTSIALAIVLWQGGYIAESEVGTFSMFMTYAQSIIDPIRWIVNEIETLISTQVNIERYSNLINTKSDVTDTPEVIEKYGDCFNPKRENWEELYGEIEFKDLSFKYPDGDEYILEHFNLKIPKGSSIAIVGETGAGKSTLVNLICRFFEPTSGAVFIDGRDARERSQLWLHSSIGYVLQTPHLFSGTIRENLLYGNPDATEEQMITALKTVSAYGIIERLESGLDTDVGEGGDMLSTGEKQLISFARAILCDPKILVLDEATASIDTLTEQTIQTTMDSMISGRTSIMIAHRLSTVKNADHILVIKNGKIVEEGTHTSLLKAKGYYHSLYTRQYEDSETTDILNR